MIDLEDVLFIHSILIQEFGGTPGIRSNGLLESAIKRPFQTFDGNELYPTALDKAAAIIESIVKNHPFVDGNKRTGYVLMRLFLRNNQLDINIDEEEKYQFVIKVASGKYTIDQIKNWIEVNTEKISGK